MTRSRSGSVVEASSIVWTSTKHAPIRNAIVQILEKAGFGTDEHGNEVKLERCRCPVDYFVLPLNTIIGVKVGGDMAPFTEDMLRQAFAFEGNNPSSFADCRIAIGADVEGVLHIRSGWQGSHRDGKVVYDISLFPDLQSASVGCNHADADDIIPLRRIKSVNLDFISDNIRNALQKFAKTRKSRLDNDTKAAKQHEQQESNRRKRTAVESMDADVEPGTDALRMKVNDVKRRREELLAQLDMVDEEFKSSTAALNNAVGSSSSGTMECNPYDYQHVGKKRGTELTEDRTIFSYYLGTAAGVLDLVGPPTDHVLVHEDLKRGLLDRNNTNPPPGNMRVVRSLAGHKYFLPPSHELAVTNRSAQRVSNKTVVNGIQNLLSKDISTWTEKAKRIFTAMSTFGYGCSDEGTRFIMGGSLSALFNEVGLEFEGEQVSNVVPSGDTLKNWEINLATDCLFGLCWELKEAKVTQLGITTDHGHRKGQDHLVKLLSFPSITSTGDLTIEFMCLNVDSAGHKTEEAASAISDDVSALLEILRTFVGEDVKLSVITGDAGGGAAVQLLHPELQKKGTMDEWSKKLSCDLHNWNKALEVACTRTWGQQGIGHRTPFQMIWLFVRILKHFRDDLGRDRSLLDEAWGMTIQFLREDPKWQGIACDNCNIAFTDFMDRLEALENGDEDALAAALNMSSKAPANIQDPVMTRWGTILAAVRFFADNWVVIYFFAMTVANSEKSDSHLCTMCCALLSLMHNTTVSATAFETADTETPLPTVDGDEIDAFAATFESNTSILIEAAKNNGPSTPIFLAVIHFLDAFNEAFFGDMYNFMRMNDPFLGEGTFGQLARFGPERCSVMHTLLLELESGAWKEKAEFKRFREAYDSVAGDEEKKYLDTAVGVFFREFRGSFENHMVAKWTSTEIVHYLLGGDPHHAKEFARWLVHHHFSKESSADDEDEMIVEFDFEDKRITLGHHHRRYRGDVAIDVEINLRDSMNFITMNADPLAILDDPFIKRNWTHIEALADEDEETTAVDIWDKSSKASFTKYKPFREDIIRTICIHSSHQQRCENYVQLCGLISMTGVGEVRRTCRAIINSIIHRRFNLWALQCTNEKRIKEGKSPVTRVQGSERMTLFQTFIDRFFKKVEKAKEHAPDLWKSVRERLSNGSVKASNRERLNRMRTFHDGLKKAPKTVKAVQPMGIEQTVHTSKAVQLSLLTNSRNKFLPAGMIVEDILQAELDARKLVMKAGEETNLKAQRDAIQLHEFGRIKQRDPMKDVTLKQVVGVQPMSDLMKKYLADGHQQRIMDAMAMSRRNG